MIDLESEFDSLVEEIHKLIRAKQVNGDLTRAEADGLTQMVEDRLTNTNRGWRGSDWCVGG